MSTVWFIVLARVSKQNAIAYRAYSANADVRQPAFYAATSEITSRLPFEHDRKRGILRIVVALSMQYVLHYAVRNFYVYSFYLYAI